MSDLLLEIYGEEIPELSQIEAEKRFHELFNIFFKENNISFREISTYSTSRRIVVFVKKLPDIIKGEEKIIRGPAASANDKAINGFLKSNEISSRKKLYLQTVKDKKYYFYKKQIKDKKISEILAQFIPTCLSEFNWKKSMRWSNLREKWIRPIKNILCILDSKIIPFQFSGIKSSNETIGNYYYSLKKIKCKSFENYRKLLDKNLVTINNKDREKIIKEKLNAVSSSLNLKSNFSEEFTQTIARLVESPNIFFGTFDKKFFSMPEDFLVTVISGQQNYFSFKDQKGKLSNVFAFVTNHSKDIKNEIRRGNERVLKARFEDALFYIKEDLQIKLIDRLEMLKKITYFEGLGSLHDKTERISNLASHFKVIFDFSFKDIFKRIFLISKCDLTTEMVKEFTSLQGVVGSYYSRSQGYSTIESDALIEQYKPISAKDFCPKSELSICLSLANKIDDIVGAFLIGKKPTGSKDPYGLRRAALGIIRILLENKIDFNLYKVLSYSSSLYVHESSKKKYIIDEISTFITVRMVVYFQSIGITQDFIDSVIKIDELNPYITFHKSKSLSMFMNNKKGQNFLASYKRIDSILKDSVSKNNIRKSELCNKYEKELYDKVNEIRNKIEKLNLNKNLDEGLKYICELTPLINLFFENVKVNVDDELKRKNRIALLTFSINTSNQLCDFSKLKDSDE